VQCDNIIDIIWVSLFNFYHHTLVNTTVWSMIIIVIVKSIIAIIILIIIYRFYKILRPFNFNPTYTSPIKIKFLNFSYNSIKFWWLIHAISNITRSWSKLLGDHDWIGRPKQFVHHQYERNLSCNLNWSYVCFGLQPAKRPPTKIYPCQSKMPRQDFFSS